MVKKIFIIAFLLLFPYIYNLEAMNSRLNQISYKVTTFLKETEEWPWEMDSIAMTMIIDLKKDKNVHECKEGIFSIITISTSTYTHFLLLDKDSAEIINMRDSLGLNISKIINFFYRNPNYSKEDILFYLNDILKTDDYNKRKYMNHIKAYNRKKDEPADYHSSKKIKNE